MILTELPTEPWQKVGTDLFHWDGKNYLLLIDYFSNYPELALLSSMSAACVIMHMKTIFARHGIPHFVFSDNGPCYSCSDFKHFAEAYDFQHLTSSPLFPQSNGKAEKGVQIVKKLLQKAKDSGSDPYLALLSYRASPLEHGKSPAELLMGRTLRTTLPYVAPKQRLKTQRSRMKLLQHRQKLHYDKSSRPLEPLRKDDSVRLQDANIWKDRAPVLEEVGPRSYTVKMEDGVVLRRNRRSLLKTQETSDLPERDHAPAGSVPVEVSPPDQENSESLGQTQTSPVVLRRSARTVRPPDRLNL
uniref:Integrase catalytic domain-containing protein n=1 Tax=Oryzias melastigma TaxID=30732 RepID=A0A3B3C851_ORYME